MSLLYFGLAVFCQFEARVPEFDAVFSVVCTLYNPQLWYSGIFAILHCKPGEANTRLKTASCEAGPGTTLMCSMEICM
jgi:hypothetical protein